MTKQYGFYYDADRCISCHTCELACKSTHSLEPGVKWRWLTETWRGEYPNIARIFSSMACMHCEQPACVAACPTGAIHKRAEDGIVMVYSDKCNGCRECLPACPFGVPQFGADGIMQKCDYCTGIGMEPACATSCPAEALHFGTIEDLLEMAKARGKVARRIEGKTQPSVFVAV